MRALLASLLFAAVIGVTVGSACAQSATAAAAQIREAGVR